MSQVFTPFSPPPDVDQLPRRLASPFASAPPHPLAARAAGALLARLARPELAALAAELERPGGGKMFGVLVASDEDGRIGWLAAFSGMLGGAWRVPGFAPPLFDEAARARFFPGGEADLAELERARAELHARSLSPLQRALAAREAEHRAAEAALAADLRARRGARALRRAALAGDGLDPALRTAALAALEAESRADKRERRRARCASADALAGPQAAFRAAEAEHAALEALQAERSRDLFDRLVEGYVLVSARGEARPLAALFAPERPPGGAGDCAAPKLLGYANRSGLRPLALAELWVGASPATGDRRAGSYYAACRRKCGPVLPFLLQGLDVEAAPLYATGGFGEAEPRTIYEDPWLLVVEKPAGMLSVPGRGAQRRDSALARLRARAADADGPLLVHRLDLDTSGLLVAAKTAEIHAVLQAMFARREVEKRYVAWLEGVVSGEAGEIELPLRVDVEDRPRQIHDPVHGKPARTSWRVLERAPGRTRVALTPHTGRTHQLRVHAAHPFGLGTPIVGDRLYGRGGDRLLLHAEGLAFAHPKTGERVELVARAPF